MKYEKHKEKETIEKSEASGNSLHFEKREKKATNPIVVTNRSQVLDS